MQLDASVAVLLPAMKGPPVHYGRSRAIIRIFWCQYPFLESRDCHENLKYGPWRKPALDGTVLHGILGIINQVIPLLLANAGGKAIGVKSGSAHQSQNFTTARI